jgi:hypothetical protein
MNIESPSNNKEIGQESLNERFPVLKVKEGNGVAGHIQPNIEIQNFDPGVRDIIRFAMLTSQMDSPIYKLRQTANAFLQGESDEWLFVEFWNHDPAAYMPFVDYLNEQIAAEKAKRLA